MIYSSFSLFIYQSKPNKAISVSYCAFFCRSGSYSLFTKLCIQVTFCTLINIYAVFFIKWGPFIDIDRTTDGWAWGEVQINFILAAIFLLRFDQKKWYFIFANCHMLINSQSSVQQPTTPNPAAQKKIEHYLFDTRRILGKGSFSTVHPGVHLITSSHFLT